MSDLGKLLHVVLEADVKAAGRRWICRLDRRLELGKDLAVLGSNLVEGHQRVGIDEIEDVIVARALAVGHRPTG